MTISSETRKAGPFTGNGVTTAFPFAFKVFVAADVSVTLTTLSTGVQALLMLNTDYTLALNADQNASPGGTVTYNPSSVPMPSTRTLTIGSVVTETQATHITNGGAFLPNNIEDMVDRAVINVQQVSEKIDRSIKFPIVDSSLIVELPTAALRANKGMKFDSAGNVTITVNDADSAASSAAASASAAAASATAAASSAAASATSAAASAGSATSAATSAATATAAAQAQLWRVVVFKQFSDSPINIVAADRGKLFVVDCSGGAVVMNLPQIGTLDLSVAFALGIKKEDASGNGVTINRASTDLIDGATSKALTVTGSGTTLSPETTPTVQWIAADFGAMAGNMTVDTFNGTGAQTAFTLSVAPGTKNNTLVEVGGVYQKKSTYSVSGTTLTFTTAPPVGTGNIEVVSGTTLAAGVPSDGTVTTAKLDSAVVSGAATDAAPDRTADFLLTGDTSAAGIKKVPLTSVGRLVQRVEATPYITYSSSAAAIPVDDTIPQVTEGAQYCTLSITPVKTTNRLVIRASFSGSVSSAGSLVLALFNGGANALKASISTSPTLDYLITLSLAHEMAAGSTSALTFTLRAGPNAATMYVNGTSSSRILGGATAAMLSVEEYE